MVYTSKRVDLMQMHQFRRIPVIVCYSWIAGLCPSYNVPNRTQGLGNLSCFRPRVGREGPTGLGLTEITILYRGCVVDCTCRYGLLVFTFVM
jgi:hypothetical protein